MASTTEAGALRASTPARHRPPRWARGRGSISRFSFSLRHFAPRQYRHATADALMRAISGGLCRERGRSISRRRARRQYLDMAIAFRARRRLPTRRGFLYFPQKAAMGVRRFHATRIESMMRFEQPAYNTFTTILMPPHAADKAPLKEAMLRYLARQVSRITPPPFLRRYRISHCTAPPDMPLHITCEL